jgi:hypothetical protein
MDPVADAKLAISEVMMTRPEGVADKADYEQWGARFCTALVTFCNRY